MSIKSYYASLPEGEKQVYYLLRRGLETMEEAISLPALAPAELSELYFALRLDHPEIFYAPSYTARHRPGSDTLLLRPDYLCSGKQVADRRAGLEARVTRLLRPALSLSKEEQLLYFHKYILEKVRYDKMKKPYSHEIVGGLELGVAVCEGISKTIKFFCDRVGIPCLIALAERAPEKGIAYRHAWNIVELGGKCFHLDATFDLSLSEPSLPRFDYFLLPDKDIFRDHEPPVHPLPVCATDRQSYYITHHLSFTKEEDLRKKVSAAAKKSSSFTFQWRGGYLSRKNIQSLCTLCADAAAEKGHGIACSLNFPQRVFSLRFTPPEETPSDLLLESSNPGEELPPPVLPEEEEKAEATEPTNHY